MYFLYLLIFLTGVKINVLSYFKIERPQATAYGYKGACFI